MSLGEFDIHQIYLNETTRDNVRINLLNFGYRTFHTAKIIEKFDYFESFVESYNKKINDKRGESSIILPQSFSFRVDKDLEKFLQEFAFESLIDSVKICICFENYFKEVLLNNGFIIHKSKVKEIYNLQKKRPIKLEDIATNKTDIKSIIGETSLTFSTLLNNKEYYSYYSIGEEELYMLRDLNDRRNRLHLYTNEDMKISNKIVNSFRELRRIVLCDIAVRINLIIEKYPASRMGKLPVNCN